MKLVVRSRERKPVLVAEIEALLGNRAPLDHIQLNLVRAVVGYNWRKLEPCLSAITVLGSRLPLSRKIDTSG